jgi:hypothetical protein
MFLPDMLRQPLEIKIAAAHIINIRRLCIAFFISILPILDTVIPSEGCPSLVGSRATNPFI